MENKKIINIGEFFIAKKDIELENKTVKKGEKVYIGADGFAHHRDGTIQSLEDNVEVKGYYVRGLADFIWFYIRNNTPINEELLDDYDESPDCVKEAIMDALEELGFYEHTENKN